MIDESEKELNVIFCRRIRRRKNALAENVDIT